MRPFRLLVFTFLYARYREEWLNTHQGEPLWLFPVPPSACGKLCSPQAAKDESRDADLHFVQHGRSCTVYCRTAKPPTEGRNWWMNDLQRGVDWFNSWLKGQENRGSPHYQSIRNWPHFRTLQNVQIREES